MASRQYLFDVPYRLGALLVCNCVIDIDLNRRCNRGAGFPHVHKVVAPYFCGACDAKQATHLAYELPLFHQKAF